MRRPWIKIETATPDKPEICAIATTLRMDADAVLGKLVRLWSWVEVNRAPANDLGVTKEFIDKLVGRKGFAAALVVCGWLVEGDGKLGLKNLDRHNGGLAKVRALTAQRVAVHRKRKLARQVEIVAKALRYEPVLTPKESPVKNVETQNKPLETSQNIMHELQAFDADDVTHFETLPVTADSPEFTPPEPAMGAAPVIEEEMTHDDNAPRKRRSRTQGDSPDQPLLF
ncbi:hypothetical protein [Prosthecobacter sp.]|uniref:hypothetical protein n=1 Tax=Prosthecobacter sp. TaxID=1965333 RepID=UPI002ABC9BF2|nr:hypothetical protein [Prosthecobacter sp.]MDZ4406343.1 hypothetical protein [Prosthecobacter sp.]